MFITPLLVFAGDIDATAFGTTKDAAEKNAYIELSKYINVSVYNEEKISEFSDNNSNTTSQYSSQAIQTTANNFINSTKTFKEVNGGYNCTVVLSESVASNYISRIEDYVTSINSLENQYESNKDKASIEVNKVTIKNILSVYSEYDSAKAVLLALNKYSSTIAKPNKTSDIWNNEYQNIIIKYNNELAEKKSKLNSSDNSYEIASQIDAINIEIAKATIELNNFEQQKSESLNQSIVQKQKEMDNEISNILNKLRVERTTSAFSNQSDIKSMLDDFNAYYNQYNNINNQYDSLIATQNSQNKRETLDGVDAITNRAYLFSEVDRYSRPSIVAKKIRENEIENFKTNKQKELETNLKIIDDRFVPMQNQLQSKMLELLANIDKKSEFIISINPQTVSSTLNTSSNTFICTLSNIDSYPPLDNFKVEIPLGSIDQNMIFNINDSNFDVNDASQINAYNSYNQRVAQYKSMIENNNFLTYQLKIKLNLETVQNRFDSGNINATITSEIVDVQVLRNDTKTILNDVKVSRGINNKIVNRYDSFIDTRIKLIDKYYSPLALSFYNKINKATYYKSNDITTSINTTSLNTIPKIGNPITAPVTNYSDFPMTNALGDPYAVANRNYASDDKFFLTIGLGFIPVSDSFKDSIISDYYEPVSETSTYAVYDAPFITQLD
ncbi:MAG: hypothetical protein JJE21_10685, partial [Spirochaetaceae bacterium]|nr:hypothetical protein [Spirochaetaceae bacterium]